ncbi:hypothetical protein GH714_013141 [Hevea brasiliensis]|uniref:Protein kinase domain-containing protein n=1 Tax=Hevea brasiliensis TaxID=3981 RepID=A0A6A6N870_HEVBR|nr:hypothetical protein GH714_013141 [Hevea brasiliensis]
MHGFEDVRWEITLGSTSNPDETTEKVSERIADGYELPKIPSGISKDGKYFLEGCLVKNHEFRFTIEMLLIHPFEKEVFNHLRDYPYILECYGEETTMSKVEKMLYNLLLEYASGGTLADLIKRSGGCGLPESDVKRHTRSILKGIDYIHSHDYAHRDLKPDNVLFVRSGDGDFVPKIGDLD